MKRLQIIYIPGLGRARPPMQNLIIKTWPLWGAKATLFEADWNNEETWDSKLKRLMAMIDKLAENEEVGLVTSSAGASAAIKAYAMRKSKVKGVVIIAGMANHPEDIRDKYRRENPAFVASAYDGIETLARLSPSERSRILSIYALFDEIVNKKYSKIPGVINRRSLTVGHVITIAFQLALGAPSFLRFLKRAPTN